jgi:hypothetical protein
MPMTLSTVSNIILSLCDHSGVWSNPYREAGYTVIQVDKKLGEDALLWPSPMSDAPRLSSQLEDIRPYIGRVRGILAAPVCTYFSNAGAKHVRTDEQLREGLALVDACIRLAWVLKPTWWVLENPVGKLPKWLGNPAMYFHPCDYGDPYEKKTALYGNFNADLPTNRVEAEGKRDGQPNEWYSKMGGKSDKTKEYRSMTPPGFAKAFFLANP